MRKKLYDATSFDDTQGYVFPAAPQTPSDIRRRLPGNFSLGMLLNKAIRAGAARPRGDASRSGRRRARRRAAKCGVERPRFMTRHVAALSLGASCKCRILILLTNFLELICLV